MSDADATIGTAFPTRIDGVPELEGIVGLQASLAVSAITHHFSETCSHLQVTQKQVGIMWIIEQNPGISQTHIGKILDTDRATIMGLINRLQEQGLIVRKASELDRRRQALFLLPEGEKLIAQAKKAVIEHEKWVARNLTEREVARLIELLKKIHLG